MLVEKGVSFEVELVDENNFLVELIELNFYKIVLILVDCEFVLYDLKIIMEYLDECFFYLLFMFVYLVVCGNSCLMIYCIERNWYLLVEKVVNGFFEVVENVCNKLCNDLLILGFVFVEFEYFMSEEFSLIDCYFVLLLWCLFVLGIDLIGFGLKELKVYMNCVFECDLFLVLLIEVECEMCLVC